jgi:hypothetical protein
MTLLGAESSLTENVLPPFQAEPTQSGGSNVLTGRSGNWHGRAIHNLHARDYPKFEQFWGGLFRRPTTQTKVWGAFVLGSKSSISSPTAHSRTSGPMQHQMRLSRLHSPWVH